MGAKNVGRSDAAIKRMLDEIDDAVGRTREFPEIEVMAALVSKAEGWKMRLQELEEEQGDAS